MISIIGLLSSIVLASLVTARQKAKNSAVQQIIGEYIKAFELFHASNGYYPDPFETPPTHDYQVQQTFCLGLGCDLDQTSMNKSTALDNALKPYYPGLPKIVDPPIDLGGGWIITGEFTCFDSDIALNVPNPPDYIPGRCQVFKIGWALNGNSECYFGADKLYHTSNFTICSKTIRDDR